MSPFDKLVNALNCAAIEGKDSTLVPLTQKVLNELIASKAKMQDFIKDRFQHRGTHEELSDTDVRDLAWAAMIRLEIGAFLYKLGRACAMSVSPLTCALAHVCITSLRISMRHCALPATKQVRRCSRSCCTLLVAHTSLLV